MPFSTIDALRKTLLAAKSIAYSDSSSGTYLATIGSKKLGVADEISGKTRKVRGPPSGELGAAVVARGEAELGFQQVPELIHVPGVNFVGTVPSDVQPPTLFVGALTKNSQQPDIAIALLHFLLFRGRSRNHESRIGAICGALRLDHRPTHGHCSMVRSGGWHHALGSERSTQRSDRAQFSSGTAHFSISAIGNQTRHPGAV